MKLFEDDEEDYFEDEEFLSLLKEYENAVQSGQPVFMDADDLADIADYYQENGQYKEAQGVIDRLLEIAPESPIALIYKTRDALSYGETDKAQGYLDKLIDKDDLQYVYCQAEVYIARDQIETADNYLRDHFANVMPDEYEAFVLDVAELYSNYGLDDMAMQWMMRAPQQNTDDFKEVMARTLSGLGKYEDSERIFNELIDKQPFQKRYWNGMASVQFLNEDYQAAVTSSEYALAIDPADAEGLVTKANGLYRLGNYEEALEYYRRYVKQEPDDEYGYMHQGSCLINLGNYEEAIEQLKLAEQKADPNSPDLPDIYQELGFAYSEQKMPETALYYIDKTDDLDCDHTDMLVIRGHILLSNGRNEEAQKMFGKAIKRSDNSPHTLMRIIVSFLDNKYVDAAYNMFEEYFKMVQNESKEGYAYMALCCWELKRTDEFMYYLKTACEKNPSEAQQILFNLFPTGMKSADYYQYMTEQLKK